MYYQIKQVKILLKRGHIKMLIIDISGPWVLYYNNYVDLIFFLIFRQYHVSVRFMLGFLLQCGSVSFVPSYLPPTPEWSTTR